MQLMGHRAGAELRPVTGHVATCHPLEGAPDEVVNSFHGLALAGCPAGYRVLARAADGTIEAIRHLSLPWEGWMWHPEREAILRRQDIDAIRSVFA
jgi:putative glutamine amidotransferase